MSIFKMLDLMEDVRVERICTDTKINGNSVQDVDVLGFSTSFEIDFGIVNILNKYHIPVKSSDRKESDPLFLAGPCFNANLCRIVKFMILLWWRCCRQFCNVFKIWLSLKICQRHCLAE
jgi:hypothetical protein